MEYQKMMLKPQNGFAGLPCRVTFQLKNAWEACVREEKECHKIMLRLTSGITLLQLKEPILHLMGETMSLSE